MKIVIVGPGAMGCLFGGFLAKSGEEVWMLDKNPQRAELLSRESIRIEGISGEHKAKVKATVNPKDIGEPRLIIICVKSYDTSAAARLIQDLVGKDTLVLTLQNGAGNLEELAQFIAPDKLLGGTTAQGATVLGPGHIRHAGKGETVIGFYKNQKSKIKNQKLKEIENILSQAGFSTSIAENVQDLIWSKLIINVGINALTALTHLNNGRLPEFAGTKEILRLAVEEAVAVVERKGIKLIFDNPVAKVEAVCEATAGNVASMLQDVLKHRRTEIDYINGAIVRAGEGLGIPTPVNRVLWALVKTIEESYGLQVK